MSVETVCVRAQGGSSAWDLGLDMFVFLLNTCVYACVYVHTAQYIEKYPSTRYANVYDEDMS